MSNPDRDYVQVTMKFPKHVWGRLATIADDRGVNVPQVIAGAVAGELKPRDRREWVLTLVRNGYPDRIVADITGELKQYVSTTRRRAGLPANPDRGRHAQAPDDIDTLRKDAA